MAVPRLRVPPNSLDGSVGSEEVELYHRTYTTLLRSSGETRLRVLEPSHAAMNSSLHSLAGSLEDVDLGAYLYALRRLPASVWRGHRGGLGAGGGRVPPGGGGRGGGRGGAGGPGPGA